MEQDIQQIGILGVFAILVVKELIGLIKYGMNSKKGNNGNNQLLTEIREMNTNHLTTIDKSLNDGFDRVVKAITDMNIDLAEKLGEIKGTISRIK